VIQLETDLRAARKEIDALNKLNAGLQARVNALDKSKDAVSQ
jgi:hypothetical protein